MKKYYSVLLAGAILFSSCGTDCSSFQLNIERNELQKIHSEKRGNQLLEADGLKAYETEKWKDGENKFKIFQEVYEILNNPTEELQTSLNDFEGHELYILNQPNFYLIGLLGSYFQVDYFLYRKEKQKLICLDNILTESVIWDSVVNATTARNENVIVFPYSGFKTFTATDFPSTVLYDIENESYQKEYAILAGDRLQHSYIVGKESNESFWKIGQINQTATSLSINFEVVEEVHDTDYYYPDILLRSDESGKVILWMKQCELDMELIKNINIRGMLDLSVSKTVIDGETGLQFSFTLEPNYFLFGKVHREATNLVGGPLTLFVQKDKKVDESYLCEDDM